MLEPNGNNKDPTPTTLQDLIVVPLRKPTPHHPHKTIPITIIITIIKAVTITTIASIERSILRTAVNGGRLRTNHHYRRAVESAWNRDQHQRNRKTICYNNKNSNNSIRGTMAWKDPFAVLSVVVLSMKTMNIRNIDHTPIVNSKIRNEWTNSSNTNIVTTTVPVVIERTQNEQSDPLLIVFLPVRVVLPTSRKTQNTNRSIIISSKNATTID